MGTSYSLPKKTGPSPFTRSGEPPVKLTQVSEKPDHRTHELMSLQLHMADERQRMAGLSPAEREWRAKWLKDQHLHPDEPVHVDAVHRQLNPVRVLYRKPWDVLYRRFLNPTFGPFYGLAIRAFVPKVLMGLILVEALYYQTKYNARNWQRYTGFIIFTERDIRSADQIEKDHPGLLAKGLDQNDKFGYFDPTYFNRDSLLNVGEPVRKY